VTVEAACPFLRWLISWWEGWLVFFIRWFRLTNRLLAIWSRKCRRLCRGLPFGIDCHPHKEGIRCTDVQHVVKCCHWSPPCHHFRGVHAKHWVCCVDAPLMNYIRESYDVSCQDACYPFLPVCAYCFN